MEYSVFVKLAEKEINAICDLLEERNFSGDFDLINGVLSIYTDQGEYVINQHSPTKQIWLSSPVSSAGYFNYDFKQQDWIDKNLRSLKKRILHDLGI